MFSLAPESIRKLHLTPLTCPERVPVIRTRRRFTWHASGIYLIYILWKFGLATSALARFSFLKWRSALTWRLCTTTLRVVTIFVTNTTVDYDFAQVNLSSDRVASFHCIPSTNVFSEEFLAAEVTQNWHFPKVQCPSPVFRTLRALWLHPKMHRGSSSHPLMLYSANVVTNKIELFAI